MDTALLGKRKEADSKALACSQSRGDVSCSSHTHYDIRDTREMVANEPIERRAVLRTEKSTRPDTEHRLLKQNIVASATVPGAMT